MPQWLLSCLHLRGSLTNPDEGLWELKNGKENSKPVVTLAPCPFLPKTMSSLLGQEDLPWFFESQNSLLLLVKATGELVKSP